MVDRLGYCRVYLYSGRTPVEWAVRWQSRSKYSHAAIEIRGWLYEALCFQGVVKRGVKEHDRKADCFDVYTSPHQRDVMRDWLNTVVGQKYDWLGVARFVSRRNGGHPNRWFCSELVYEALSRANMPLFERTQAWEVSPGDLAKLSVLRRKGQSCEL